MILAVADTGPIQYLDDAMERDARRRIERGKNP